MASDTARAEGAGGRTGPCSSHPWNASGGPPISRFVFRCCFPGADNSRSVTAPRSVGRPRRCAENPPAQRRGLDERTAYAITSIAGAGLSVNVRTAPGQAAIHGAMPEARSTNHARPPPGPGRTQVQGPCASPLSSCGLWVVRARGNDEERLVPRRCFLRQAERTRLGDAGSSLRRAASRVNATPVLPGFSNRESIFHKLAALYGGSPPGCIQA